MPDDIQPHLPKEHSCPVAKELVLPDPSTKGHGGYPQFLAEKPGHFSGRLRDGPVKTGSNLTNTQAPDLLMDDALNQGCQWYGYGRMPITIAVGTTRGYSVYLVGADDIKSPCPDKLPGGVF